MLGQQHLVNSFSFSFASNVEIALIVQCDFVSTPELDRQKLTGRQVGTSVVDNGVVSGGSNLGSGKTMGLGKVVRGVLGASPIEDAVLVAETNGCFSMRELKSAEGVTGSKSIQSLGVDDLEGSASMGTKLVSSGPEGPSSDSGVNSDGSLPCSDKTRGFCGSSFPDSGGGNFFPSPGASLRPLLTLGFRLKNDGVTR